MFLKITCVRVTATAFFESLFCSGHGAKLFTYNFPLILCNITMGAKREVPGEEQVGINIPEWRNKTVNGNLG